MIVGFALIGLLLVAAVAYLTLSWRRASERGEVDQWKRGMRRGHAALAIYFGGTLLLALLASWLGASTHDAGRVAGFFATAFLVGVIVWRVRRKQ